MDPTQRQSITIESLLQAAHNTLLVLLLVLPLLGVLSAVRQHDVSSAAVLLVVQQDVVLHACLQQRTTSQPNMTDRVAVTASDVKRSLALLLAALHVHAVGFAAVLAFLSAT